MRLRLLALSALVVSLAACGGDSATGTGGTTGGTGGGTGPVATNSVSLSGLAFVPSAIVVAPGSTVTWTNNDGGITHNVTFSSAAIASIGDFSSGSQSAVMPTATGTYSYHCTIHAGMTGTVQVQ